MRIRKKLLSAAAATALVGGTLVVATAPAAQATPAPCNYAGWNNGLKNATNPTEGFVGDIDAGRHRCYERIVVRRSGDSWPGYDIRYVPVASTDGEGCPAKLGRGNKVLRVMVDSPAYNHYGQPTTPNRFKKIKPGEPCYKKILPLRTWTNAAHTSWQTISFASYKSIKTSAWLGSFEGQTSFALGIKPTPACGKPVFRVFTANGNRDVVIDVKAFNPDLAS